MRRNPQSRLLFGAALLIVGLLALAGNLNIIDVRDVFQFWPVVFIFIGVTRIIQRRSSSGLVIGGAFIVVGVLLILRHLGLIDVRMRELWPVGLIALGVFIMFKDRLSKNLNWGSREARSHQEASPDTRIITFMSGNVVKNASQDYRGGEITAIMGGVELDLRAASIQNEACLEVFAMWGGIEITVPPDWIIVSDCVPLLGGVGDKTIPPMASEKCLRIKGMVIMGGVEIKN